MVAQRDPYEFPAIRAFAAELEAWRGSMAKTELAEVLGYTPQLIGQLEAAKNIPSQKFAEDLDTYFKTNGLFVRLAKLVNETRHLAILPPGFPEFVAREAEASKMYIFEANVITGLFQTREYAYELMRPGRSPEEIEELVAKRMDRQAILGRTRPPRIVTVFDELAIHRVLGGSDVMRGQVARLIEVAEQPNVTLQIVPNGVGSYAGLPGAFTILGCDDGPDMVYIESHVGGQVIADRATVREYEVRYDLIRGAAISADESLKLLHMTLESS
jgi:hypothetical protein